MHAFFTRFTRLLGSPLNLGPRLLLVAAAVLLVAIYVLPLWNLTMFAPQYPDGLRLDIYSYKFEAGNAGQDLKEINVLNHYIGMRDLEPEDFTEFKWIPFVVGIMGLLFLRAAVFGHMAHVLDVLVLYTWFGLFSLWSFAYKMYRYGHDLDPKAAMNVEPFMPPLFGGKQLANFEVFSYPQAGSYTLALAMLFLALALYFGWRETRKTVA